MADFEFNMDGLMEEIESLAREVPEAIPKALNAMADILVDGLRGAAPEGPGDEPDGHLRDAIGKTGTRTSKNGTKYKVVHIKNRGEKDRNVLKAVVLEYGRSGKRPIPRPDKPFWRTTVEAKRQEMLEAAKQIMDEAVEKAAKK